MSYLKTIATWTFSAFSIIFASNIATAELMNLRVTSSSMMPTFGPGDVVATTSYKPEEKIERGDLVAYKVHYISKMPPFPDTTIDTVFIGRVIGLPNETVEIEDGVPLINGIALETIPIKSTVDGGCPEEAESSTYYQCRFVRESTPEGKSYILLDMRNGSVGDNVDLKALGSKEYYVMGDNRDNANDSRFNNVGLISKDRIRGKVRMISASVRTLGRQWRLDGFPELE
ncbi:signal peptidase I [Ochrobactrum sp. SD129]|jgi:signal peptidase I|nr:signal peptidase I [Ochrobactrum sp. SD129]